MSKRMILGLAVASFVGTACSNDAQAVLDTDDQKASYAIGLDVGGSLRPTESHLDMPALVKGIRDALAEADPAVPEEELQEIMQAFSATIQEEMQAEAVVEAEENTAAGVAFMEENGAKDGVITTESGLQYEILTEGTGANPVDGQEISVHYTGTLPDGTEFDSTDPEGPPANFGVNGVISGFSEGLKLMKVGAKHRMVIPGDLAYGPPGRGELIGPNQVLIFEVELIEIN